MSYSKRLFTEKMEDEDYKVFSKIIDGTIETMPEADELEGEPDIDAIEEQLHEQEEIEEERIGKEQADWGVGHGNLRFM